MVLESYIVIPAIWWALSSIGYLFFSKYMDKVDIRTGLWRLLIPSLVFGVVLYILFPGGVVWQSLAIPLAVGVLNQYVYPLFFAVTQRKQNIQYRFPYDFVMGIYLASLLTALAVLASVSGKAGWGGSALLSLAEFLCLGPVFLQLFYFAYYGESIGDNGINAFFQTNRKEAGEYMAEIPLAARIAAPLFLVLVAGGLFLLNLGWGIRPWQGNVFAGLVPMAAVCFLLFGKGKKSLVWKTALGTHIHNVWQYRKTVIGLHEQMKGMVENLEATSGLADSGKGTVLVVIGESANRLHMNAFSDYERETTPWMSSLSEEDGFFVFKNAYTSWIQTEMAVYLAMTGANQYNGRKIHEAVSLVDVAGKCGYKTWWYSNQGFVGEHSNIITLIGQGADHRRWMQEDASVSQYDGKLMDYLQRVEPGENNFVVLHLMGSHSNFCSRYPEEWGYWPVPGGENCVNSYDNSIRYTDHVLKTFWEYAREHLNLQAMVYFSDHGARAEDKRRPTFTDFEDARVPFCVYLSEEYRKKYPETAANLHANRDRYVSNDLVFDLLCGLMHVDTEQYDGTADLSSASYRFTKETARSNLGRTSLAEDPRFG